MHHPGARAPGAAALRALANPTRASVLFAALFTATMVVGRHTVPEGSALALVSPCAGVAAVWFNAPRSVAGRALDAALLVVPGVLVHLATGATPLLAVAATVATLVQTLLFTALLRRWCPGAGPGQPLRGVLQLARLLAACGIAVSVGGVLAASAAAWETDRTGWVDLLTWVARNGLAVLLVGCAGLRLVTARTRRPRTAETVLAFAVSGAAYTAQFALLGSLPVTFLLPVLTVWVALRLRSRTVVLHCLFTGACAVVFTLHGHGPFAAVADHTARALLVQGHAAVAAVIGLVLALGRDERDALLAEVRRQAADAQRQAETAELLTGALRSLNAAADTREALCEATARITGADGVYLAEPDGRGALVSRAVWGEGMVPVSVPVGEPTVLADAFRRGEPLFVSDLAGCTGAAARLRDALGAVSVAYQPITTADGQTAGLLASVWRTRVQELPAQARVVLATLAQEAAHGIERADLLAQLAVAAERDPLTGLANRRRWDEATSKEIARTVRSGLPLSFCLIDLDHFKRYNDTQGHLAGDDLLQEFAVAASGCLREVDTLARWGGEEFVLALPGCSVAGARAVADRIRAAVPRGQTCTIGVAQWQPGLSAAEVIALADLALYEGKEAGRNTTVVSTVVSDASPAPAPVP
ncbi:diguanylate cyclase [Paenibacillus sp. TRM 82003]|uniref:sensor domain-containing diguanylate cyclase n=1 Tax=Kineococcus sp. TRM81007 TaxID=2925831 RepID=UPI001F5A1304|nr:diguanylate cyclase [Kineococcus sp. TRM81007]MCI2238647.1 diguanylate cyclase [Kineococcus sp. TRM81007]MCI3927309.1 diguanylate cyclase [Paenibacillus sp. TRM 82003]